MNIDIRTIKQERLSSFITNVLCYMHKTNEKHILGATQEQYLAWAEQPIEVFPLPNKSASMALYDLSVAAATLNEEWEELLNNKNYELSNALEDNYPFDIDFNEVPHQILSIIEEMQSKSA